MSDLEPSDALALVEQSPEAVAAHDKPRWLGLFTATGEVHDPVGTPAHRGETELSAFWDTFIAPNQVRFEVLQDVVTDHEVVREVLIHTTLANGVQVTVPTHLVYEVARERDALRIARLSAYWRADAVTRATLGQGPKGVGALVGSTRRMLVAQGVRRTVGYGRGIARGIGARGTRAAGLLATAIGDADETGLLDLFTGDATIALPAGEPCAASAFLAGPGAGIGLRLGDPIACAWTVSCPVEVARSGGVHRGLVFLDFDPPTRRIARARFYLRPD